MNVQTSKKLTAGQFQKKKTRDRTFRNVESTIYTIEVASAQYMSKKWRVQTESPVHFYRKLPHPIRNNIHAWSLYIHYPYDILYYGVRVIQPILVYYNSRISYNILYYHVCILLVAYVIYT